MADHVGKIVLDAGIDGGDLENELVREVRKNVLPAMRDVNREAAHTKAAIAAGFRPDQVNEFRKAVGLAVSDTESAREAARRLQAALKDVDASNTVEVDKAMDNLRRSIRDAGQEARLAARDLQLHGVAARKAAEDTSDLQEEVDKLENKLGLLAKAAEHAETKQRMLDNAQVKEERTAKALAKSIEATTKARAEDADAVETMLERQRRRSRPTPMRWLTASAASARSRPHTRRWPTPRTT